MNNRLTAALLLLAAASAAAASPAFAGTHYIAVTRSEGPRTGVMEVESWVSGDKARIEFRQSDNPMARSGTYLLTRDGGHTLYLVNPQEKTYTEWNLDAMLGMMGGILGGGLGPLLKIELSDPKVQKVLEEDGGTIAGQPTRHVRYHTTYTMKVKVLGMGRATETASDEDLWVTTKPLDAGVGVWLRTDPPRTGNRDFDQLLAGQWQHIDGFPMRTVTVTTNTDSKGKQSVTKRTMEVTEFGTAAVPDSRFELPAGYQERQLAPPPNRG